MPASTSDYCWSRSRAINYLSPRDRRTISDRAAARVTALPEVSAATLRYIGGSAAANTVRAYRGDLNEFGDWCAAQQLAALPASPATVANYVSRLADDIAAVSTIERRLAAIAKAHGALAATDPTVLDPTRDALVRLTVQDIKRQLGEDADQASPLTLERVGQLLEAVSSSTNAGRRDRALILVGFYGAFRRSELSDLDVEQVSDEDGGVVVSLATSKASQTEAVFVPIPAFEAADLCPVAALRAWRAGAGITSGPLLRPVNKADRVGPGRLSGAGINRIVQRLVRRAGLDDPGSYSAHSLRAGFVTTAKDRGLAEDTIMRHTRHKSVLIMRRYDRRAGLWVDNAAVQLAPPPSARPDRQGPPGPSR